MQGISLYFFNKEEAYLFSVPSMVIRTSNFFFDCYNNSAAASNTSKFLNTLGNAGKKN